MRIQSVLVLLTLAALLLVTVVAKEEEGYGVDVSWPMHYQWTHPLNDERKAIYDEFMEGCRQKYKKQAKMCDENEQQRLDMTLRQPQSMVNYTDTGFMKIRAPEKVRELLTEYWERNKDKKTGEKWGKANIYTNHWAAPTYMASVEDPRLGGGNELKAQLWDAAKETIERWTGMEIEPTSMYGVRVYTEGAILSPHVDRIPLISSCIVNVAQDVDEPWPLEVVDREGKAVNVTMEPGDMVLYESHSLIHGRPFPLKGKYFANIFIHFEPTGKHLYHRKDDPEPELDDFLPPYIIPGSPEDANWRSYNPNGWKLPSPSAAQVDGKAPEAHLAAQEGDKDRLKEIAAKNARLLTLKDRNGWQPIHEAVRGGHVDAIEFLVENGADINARTHGGKGNTPLNLALEHHSKRHPVAKYLLSLGALDIGPEL